MTANTFPLHRYQFNCHVLAPLKFNLYAGSMLRGAFGRALRKAVCVTRGDDCKSCLLYRQCSYPKIFETPPPSQSQFQNFSQIPNAFIIEPPPLGKRWLQPGEGFSFNMILIGKAVVDLPIIIHAWQKALKAGLGAEHAAVELDSVVFEPGQAVEQTLYPIGQEQMLVPAPHFSPPALTETQSLALQILTPLRIQQQGRVLSQDMTAKDFLNALVRRYYLLAEFHSDHYQPPDFRQLSEQATAIRIDHQINWCEWERYSHRQKQAMTFGGVIGTLWLEGELTPFLSLLQIGQWLHVGNKTTFGMGRYQLLT